MKDTSSVKSLEISLISSAKTSFEGQQLAGQRNLDGCKTKKPSRVQDKAAVTTN